MSIGSDQIEHNAGDRRIGAVLIDADRGDVFLPDFSSLLNYAESRIWEIDYQARRRVEGHDLRNHRCAREDFDGRSTLFMNNANALYGPRRTKVLGRRSKGKYSDQRGDADRP